MVNPMARAQARTIPKIARPFQGAVRMTAAALGVIGSSMVGPVLVSDAADVGAAV